MIVLAKNFTLTEAQKRLLGRGLKFIPVLGQRKDQLLYLEHDMQEYHRRIKLTTYFKEARSNKTKRRFVKPSMWTPPMEKLEPEVRTLVREDKKFLRRTFHMVKEKENISQEEKQALTQLRYMKDIVIKQADKGSSVVIMSREQYIFEVERQLNDSVYYQKLDKPIFTETMPMVEKILAQLKDKKFITKKQYQYLRGDGRPRERRFYILPKIHKDPATWTVPHEIPAGRPIVSDCSSETYGTAEFLDYHLNPLSTKHAAYVKDTYHFISMIKKWRIPPQAYFFSMDVSSLYTNIPIEAGIKCVSQIFDKYPDPNRPDSELLQLLDLNLKRNDFAFNEKYYLQIKGTAMGKKFAPAYANIFMAAWEEGALASCPIKPMYYLRYLDDIFGIWTESEAEFREFVDKLNQFDPSIQLKAELEAQAISFLDTMVYKGVSFHKKRVLDIKVYFKKTDTHALLHYHSFHPRHTFRGLVKSQLLRFKRICSNFADWKEATNTLFQALKLRGYCRGHFREAWRDLQNVKVQNETEEELIPFISTFSTNSLFYNKYCKQSFFRYLIETGVLRHARTLAAHRRNPNLTDILVKARLPSLRPIRKSEGRGTLIAEQFFQKPKAVRNSKDGTIYILEKQGITPRTKNVVYLIYCSRCGKKYVGETGNSLSVRFTQHRYNVRNKRDMEKPVVSHFVNHGVEAMKVAGLQRSDTWSAADRRKIERLWIYRLTTKEPWGLNRRFE